MIGNEGEARSASYCLSNLPSSVLEQIIHAASDLCLFVNHDERVEDIMRGGALDLSVEESWLGQPLKRITLRDSWPKLDLLRDAGQGREPIWRHLNFFAPHIEAEGLPLLVRRVDAADRGFVLVCRDLRPSMRLQRKINHVMTEMTQSKEDSLHPIPAQAAYSEAQPIGKVSYFRNRAASAVDGAMGNIGKLSLEDIMSQTARVLEDLCIQRAYEDCGHDLSKTAELLGISSDDLARRLPVAP